MIPPEENTPSTEPKKKVARGTRTNVDLVSQTIAVYAGRKLTEAVAELTADMTIYHGVKLSQIAEAVYKQGRKDGAREVFEQFEALKKSIPHRNPGQPKKVKKRRK